MWFINVLVLLGLENSILSNPSNLTSSFSEFSQQQCSHYKIVLTAKSADNPKIFHLLCAEKILLETVFERVLATARVVQRQIVEFFFMVYSKLQSYVSLKDSVSVFCQCGISYPQNLVA